MNRIQGQNIYKSKLDLQKVPEQYRNIAKGMEQQFVQFMIEQMHKSAPSTQEDSSATKFYKSLLTQRHAEIMTDKDEGLGIQHMILEKILPDQIKDRLRVVNNNGNEKYQAQIKNKKSGNLTSLGVQSE